MTHHSPVCRDIEEMLMLDNMYNEYAYWHERYALRAPRDQGGACTALENIVVHYPKADHLTGTSTLSESIPHP